MITDPHLYAIFQAVPAWIFDLAEREPPKDPELKSITLKAIERRCDAVVFHAGHRDKITVIEFQFDNSADIYARTAEEMALIQQESGMPEVEGIIFFRYPHLDPKTEPWCNIIQSLQLRDVLERLAQRSPDHPLVAVFQPVLLTNEQTLEERAADFYNQIKSSDIDDKARTTLLDVFVSWIEQRLQHKGKKEIEAMLLGELTDLRETQSGKDLIKIGKQEGKIEDLTRLLERKFGQLNAATLRQIEEIHDPDAVDALLDQLFEIDTLDQLKW